MNNRVLVTGGNGSLGQELVPRLLDAAYTVRITSRSPRSGDEEDGIERVQAALDSAGDWVAAVHGVDTVVHLASSPFERGVDVEGTRHLLAAAKEAGVSHIVYMSIVGVDYRDWYYYSAKHDCERLVEQSGIPFSIQRATQFHDFIHIILSLMLTRGPVGLLPRGWRFQPIDKGEVAGYLFDAIQNGPSGRLADLGGPQILSLQDTTATWLAAAGQRRVITVPFSFLMGRTIYLMGRAFGTGHNLVRDRRVGVLTWKEWVAQHVHPSSL